MEEEFSAPEASTRKQKVSRVQSSRDKTSRVMLLAILFQVSWPIRLTRETIRQNIRGLYGDNPQKAINRDIAALADCDLEALPAPDAANLAEWCAHQQKRRKLAITYDQKNATFGLAQPIFTIDLEDHEARAFLALKEGFTPGTPYAEAVQFLLGRWEWLFSEKSRQLVQQKRGRAARPVLLPLSPATDYSQHDKTILKLDAALEEGAYISFLYTPMQKSWNDAPDLHQNVEPYELEYREGHWYFTAYVAEISSFLDYRVDRMHPGSLTRDRRDRYRPGLRTRPGVKIRYWVAPEMARHGTLSARLREQQVNLLDENQGAIVEGYARSLWWASKLLLGYGNQVRALAPLELVQKMGEITFSTHRLYTEE